MSLVMGHRMRQLYGMHSIFILSALIICTTLRSGAATDLDRFFFSGVDPDKSSGFIAVRRLDAGPGNTNPPPNFIVVYSWTNKIFRADIIAPQGEQAGAYPTGKIVASSGTFGVTNWEYRNRKLTLLGRPGASRREQVEALAGRTPFRHEFEVLLGRGMLFSNFTSLKRQDPEFSGHLASGAPIRGTVKQMDSPRHFLYTYNLDGTPDSYSHEVTLEPFGDQGYIPVHLTTWLVNAQGSNVYSDFLVVGSGSAIPKPLDPAAVGPIQEVFELDLGQLYKITKGRKELLEDKARPLERPRAAKRVVLVIVLALILSLPFLLYALRQRGRQSSSANRTI